MAATSFGQPANNIVATVNSGGYTAGSGVLAMTAGNGALFPALTAGWFYRITVIQNAVGYSPTINSSNCTIFKATSLVTDTFHGVVAIEGTTDRNYVSGDVVDVRVTAGTCSDLQTAVNNLETASTNAFDFMSTLSKATISISGTSNLTYGTMSVCSGSSAYNVTLPAPAAGKMVGVRMAQTLTNLVTVLPHASETIDGASSRIMWAGEFAVLYSDGTNWFKLFGRSIPLSCSMYNLTNQSVGQSVNSIIGLNGIASDPSGLMGNAAGSKIDILRPGSYIASMSVSWNITSGPFIYIYSNLIVKNGASVGLQSTLINASGGFTNHVSGIPVCLTGDYIQMMVNHNSPNATSVIGEGTGTLSFLQVIETVAW